MGLLREGVAGRLCDLCCVGPQAPWARLSLRLGERLLLLGCPGGRPGRGVAGTGRTGTEPAASGAKAGAAPEPQGGGLEGRSRTLGALSWAGRPEQSLAGPPYVRVCPGQPGVHPCAWHNELIATPIALIVVPAHWDPVPREWPREGAESSRAEPFLGLRKVLPPRPGFVPSSLAGCLCECWEPGLSWPLRVRMFSRPTRKYWSKDRSCLLSEMGRTGKDGCCVISRVWGT